MSNKDTVFAKQPTLGDPRLYKKELMKGMFLGNKEAYNDYVLLWDKAIASGVTLPHTVAMIDFRNFWTKGESGKWVRLP